jgi:type VI secretion system protein ImpJ
VAVKKVANQTARVRWYMGQALLPEHFETQDQAIEEELRLRMRLLPAPGWGVGSLEWDPYQLLHGIVDIQEMSLVLPSGLLIDIPGNTAPIQEKIKTAGSKVSLHVHVLPDVAQVTVTRPGALPDEKIERTLRKIRLSTDDYAESSIESFHLADLDGSLEGAWALRSDYIPPLLQTTSSPFFRSTLERIDKRLETLRQSLETEVNANFLAEGHNASGRLVLRGLFAFQALLTDVKSGLPVHPYELFKGLRSLYIDLCVHQDATPGEISRPYRHDDLAGSFGRLLERLEDAENQKKSSATYTQFTRNNGLLVGALHQDVRRAKDVFLLVQKPQIGARIDMSGVKLASESRLQSIYDRALSGIPIQHIRNPPFQHGLSSSVEFYAISPGLEWDYAVREGKVALFDSEALKKTEFYLYWRLD